MLDRDLERNVLTRRRLLQWGIGGLCAAVSVVLGVPIVKYLSYPALERQTSIWTFVTTLDEIKRGQPSLFRVDIEKKVGWEKTTRAVSVYVDTEDGKTFTALSNICTHLGCPVRWDLSRQAFLCPCHNGVFDRWGNVVSGPPPRPLDRFETRVDGEKLLIAGG